MTTRILREPNGTPRRGPTQVIRTRPHTCGRNCPMHRDLSRFDAMRADAKAAMLERRRG